MIRAARASTDTLAIVGLIEGARLSSKYAGSIEIDAQHARRLIAALIQRHGGMHDGGSCVFVSEWGGAIEGFIAGTLNRVYLVGTALAATDVFLITKPGATPTAARRLINAYLEWADSNPKVAEVKLSWSDALPTGMRMAHIYEKHGMCRIGEMFQRPGRSWKGESK